ncbi:MAG: hypothetical protein ABSB35_29830 [Bryobacteraceae bacterium]
MPNTKLIFIALALNAWMPNCTVADVPPIKPTFHTPTVERLTAFMHDHRFAKPYYAREIVQMAEANRIPPSLLVCIEFVETSGGKYDHDTWNRFGWDNGKATFASHVAAIRFIAIQLGSGRYYAGKSVAEKIRVYNPRPVYARKVLDCMKEIGEEPTLVAALQ